MPLFQEAKKIIVNGGNFVDYSGPDTRKGKGIKILLDSSVQSEAIHDSYARGALGCHPGTREQYIRNITSWGSGEWQSEKRAFLMTGPAGAGKSAIARTCALNIEVAGNLGASFFFFRPSGWNDPRKFIPTIVYQLTTRYPAYHDFIDALILGDRLVLEKAMNIQFRELIVKPLQKLSAEGRGVGTDVVIIVDGLDECATVDAQVQIINLIGTSIREQTTPFLWAFFSRPEPPITSAFSFEVAIKISWTLPLTLSANADSDIEAYLRGSFQVLRAKHSIPISVAWPKEENIRRLVSQSAGLFVYPVTAIRYIGEGRCGLEERLRTVLELDAKSTENPFSALDQLYTLIVRQIPEGVLSNTISLLQLYQFTEPRGAPNTLLFVEKPFPKVHCCCFALGLSSAEFHVAISNLFSVLEVTLSQSGEPDRFRFYHKSFSDFLLDPRRSKQYFIFSPDARQHSLEMIISALGTTVDADLVYLHDVSYFALRAFFLLVEEHDRKLEENILCCVTDLREFMRRIPKDWHDRIIRPYRKGIRDFLLHKLTRLKRGSYRAETYILGKGDKKCLLVK